MAGLLNASGHPIHDAIAKMKEAKADLDQRENEAALVVEFDKLALKAGETLVMRPSGPVSNEEADSMLETARRALPPGVGVLLVCADTGLSYFDAVTTAKIIAKAVPPTSH